ncbi:MAG: hypothetical protein GY757_62305 [bacterium]|nr:hypothetical protein [bacterium]
MENLYGELSTNGTVPTNTQTTDTLHMLQALMDEKKVPPPEQEYWLERGLGNKIMKQETK